MCVAMQALEAGQCVELAPGMPTFSAGLAVAPLRVQGGFSVVFDKAMSTNVGASGGLLGPDLVFEHLAA